MSSQLEDLVRDLTQAKRKIRDAQEAVDDAKVNLAQRRKDLNDAVRAKEELENEITDPARRPMAALWNRPGAGEGSADERQRGPTGPAKVLDVSSLPKPRRSRKGERADLRKQPASESDGYIVIDPMAAAKPAAEEPAESDADAEAVEMCALHPPVEWTSEDLERELELAITAPLGEPTQAWDTFRKLGFITDVQIAEVLRSIWPRGHGFQAGRPKCKSRFAKVSPGYTIHGFPMPQFWIGARRHDTMRRPTLAERPLIDRVRQVLGLPKATPAMLDAARAQVHAEHEPVKPGRKGPRKPAQNAVAP